MNRDRLLTAVRRYLVEHGVPKAADWQGHYLLRNTARNDTCPNCGMPCAKAAEVPAVDGVYSVWCIGCATCEVFTVWPKQ